jgi:hypothetical protein
MNVLREVLDAVEPSLAAYARADPGQPRFADLVEDPQRLFVVEAVYEGYLLHYRSPRAFARMDEDLRLLAGDALYALGLSRLAEAGDMEAVAELSDLISLTATAHVEGRPEVVEELWLASARALSSEGGPGARETAHDRLPSAP